MPELDPNVLISELQREKKGLNRKYGQLKEVRRDLEAKVADLETKNQALSEKASTLDEEGTILLKGDELKAYEQAKGRLEAYEALGSLEEVQTKVASAGDAQNELAAYKRKDRLQKAFDGQLNLATLIQYDPDLDVKETTVTVEENGKQVQKTAYVVPTETGEVPALDYVTQKHAAILPALQVSSETQQSAPRQTVKIPFQGSSSSAPPVDPVAAYKKQQADKANAPTPLTKFLGAGA